jgi:hypothetical protein
MNEIMVGSGNFKLTGAQRRGRVHRSPHMPSNKEQKGYFQDFQEIILMNPGKVIKNTRLDARF